MKHIPYFSFYPADFMNGVRGLSAQEVGVYTMILCRIYEENGPVEYHPRRLSTYCGMRAATFEKVVEKLVDLGKIDLADGMLTNRRAEAEISKRAHDLKNSIRAGKKSAEKRKQNQSPETTDVQRAFNHTDTDTNTYSEEDKSSSGAEAPIDFEKLAFKRGREVLGPSAGGVIAKLKRDKCKTWAEACSLIEQAAQKHSPMEWVQGLLRRKEPEEFDPYRNVDCSQPTPEEFARWQAQGLS